MYAIALALMSLASAAEPQVGDVVWKHNVAWQYVEDYEVDHDSQPVIGPELVATEGSFHDPDPTSQVLGSVKLDGQGRRWEAIDYVYDIVPADLEEAPPGVEDDPVTSEVYEVEYESYPNDWNVTTCSNNEVVTHDYESRGQFSDASTSRTRRIVLVFHGNDEFCSGVEMETDSVLISAHCLLNANPVSPYHPTVDAINGVCSRGNTYTSGADCVISPTGGFDVLINYDVWNGSQAIEDDYVLLQWNNTGSADDANLTGTVSTGMPITTRSHSTVNGQALALYGYASYTRDGGTCTAQMDSTPVETHGTNVNSGYPLSFEWEDGGIGEHWYYNDTLRTAHDCSSGQSGGAYIICYDAETNPDCAGGEELAAIHFGHYAPPLGEEFCGGPEADQFKPFVDANPN